MNNKYWSKNTRAVIIVIETSDAQHQPVFVQIICIFPPLSITALGH